MQNGNCVPDTDATLQFNKMTAGDIWTMFGRTPVRMMKTNNSTLFLSEANHTAILPSLFMLAWEDRLSSKLLRQGITDEARLQVDTSIYFTGTSIHKKKKKLKFTIFFVSIRNFRAHDS